MSEEVEDEQEAAPSLLIALIVAVIVFVVMTGLLYLILRDVFKVIPG